MSKKLLQTKYVMPAVNYIRKSKIFAVVAYVFQKKIRKTWSFHVVVLQRTATKCTEIYNTRAQLLFCSLNLLFGDVLIAVAVVACLSSLIRDLVSFFSFY